MSKQKTRRPRYGPQSAYKARPSSSEIAGAHDFAATTLDRPLIDVEELRRAQLRRRLPVTLRVRRKERGASVGTAAFLISLASALGALFGAWIALL